METIWLWTIMCLNHCPIGQPTRIYEPTWNAISRNGCDQQAKNYIVKNGIVGDLTIVCEAHTRKVVLR